MDQLRSPVIKGVHISLDVTLGINDAIIIGKSDLIKDEIKAARESASTANRFLTVLDGTCDEVSENI